MTLPGAHTFPGLTVVLLAAFLSAGCLSRVETAAKTVSEGVEAVLSNAERPLREIPRPLRDETRLLVVAIDGFGRDAMREILDTGRAPRTQQLIGDSRAGSDLYRYGYLAPDTLSVLPSSTAPAWTSIFTGHVPATTGIVGNEFFIRQTAQFYAIAPTSVSSHLQALETINDGLLNTLIEVPTLYEIVDLRAHVSLSQVYRGADVFTLPESALLKLVFEVMDHAMDSDDDVGRAPYAAVDEQSFDAIEDAWQAYGIPDIQTVYLPGLDLYSHVVDDPLEKQLGYYQEVIDPLMGRLLDAYETRGVIDDTWVVIVSDHGHTPVIADDVHAIENEDLETPLATIGYRLRPENLEVEDEDFNAVLAAQGGLGYVYLANRSRCEDHDDCNWRFAPRWNEDVRPVLEALEKSNNDPDGLDGKIEMMLSRDPNDKETRYAAWKNGSLHPLDQWLRTHDTEHQVGFLQRIRELTEGPYGSRAGEIILVARYGAHLPREDRYYFGRPILSDHGSATLRDSRFTLLVSHRRQSGTEIKRIVDQVTGGTPRQQDFVRLATRLLGAQ